MKQNIVEQFKNVLSRIYHVTKTCQDMFRTIEDKDHIILVEDALFGYWVSMFDEEEFIKYSFFTISDNYFCVRTYLRGEIEELIGTILLPIEIIHFTDKELEFYVNEQIKIHLDKKKKELKQSISLNKERLEELENIMSE
jgi:hypothetical protein